MLTKICEACGSEFQTSFAYQKYCSNPQCVRERERNRSRAKYQRQKQRQNRSAPVYTRTCPICGSTFVTLSASQKYCKNPKCDNECSILYGQRRPRNAVTRLCAACGAEFQTTQDSNIYCKNPACHAERKRHYNAAAQSPEVHTDRQDEAESQRICSICGQAFLPEYPQQRCCGSPACEAKKGRTTKLRKCHDCGCPTDNYRCDACWRTLRQKLGLSIKVEEQGLAGNDA